MIKVPLCFLLVACTTQSSGQAPSGEQAPFNIHFAGDGVVVDADASDWEGAGRHPVAISWDNTERTRDDDLTVDAAFLFDAEHLYVLIEVLDDEFQFPDRSWRYGDGFYITVAEPTPGFRSNRYVTFGLSIEKGALVRRIVSKDGVAFPSIDTSGISFVAAKDSETHRITYEAAIPWALVAPLQPLIDEVLGLNLIYVDGEQGQREMVFLHHDRDYDTENTDLRRTTPVRFSLDEVNKTFVQFRPHGSFVRSGDAFVVAVGTANADPCEKGTIEWRITDSQGRKVGRGATPLAIGAGISRSRVEVPIEGLPSGSVRVTVMLKDCNGDRLAHAVFPVLAIAVGELEEQRSALRQLAERKDVSERVRSSLPSALFRLELIDAFLAHATPFEDVSDVAEAIEGLREAVSDVRAGRPAFANRRGVFRHAHRSAIDGTLQPYSVVIPQRYEATKEYPLLVMLHGSGVDERDVIYDAAAQARHMDWIAMAPKARGLSDWYLGDSGRDVFECIEDVRRRYSVNKECIVLMGFSAGGFGAWRLGLERPDLFAGVVALSAPLTIRGETVEPMLQKVEDLPLFVAHGTGDHAVSIEEARRAVKMLRDRDYPFLTYREISGAGHGNYESRIMPELLAWLRAREQSRPGG